MGLRRFVAGGSRLPPLLVVVSVAFDVAVIVAATFASGPLSAMHFGVALLAGNLVGHEIYLRSPHGMRVRRSRSSGLMGFRVAGSPAPYAQIRRVLDGSGAEADAVRDRLRRAGRLTALSRLNYPLLVLAIALSSPIAAALLFSLKPILTSAAFQGVLSRRSDAMSAGSASEPSSQAAALPLRSTPGRAPGRMPDSHVPLSRWILAAISVGGAAMVIVATGFSEGESDMTRPWQVFRYFSDMSVQHWAGNLLALAAAAIAALVLFANRWADQAHAHAQRRFADSREMIPGKPWLAIHVEVRALRIAIPPFAGLTLILGAAGVVSPIEPAAMLAGFLVGVVVRTPTQVCLRTAYSYSNDAALPTIESSLPLASFVALGALGQIYVQQWDALTLGVVATTLGLALLQFEVDGYRRDYFGDNTAPAGASGSSSGRAVPRADDRAMPRARYGFKALIVSMFLVGVFVCYRPTEIADRLLFRWSSQEYWGLVALSATGFFLLLAFRISSIRNRIDTEEQTIAQSLRQIGLLGRFDLHSEPQGTAQTGQGISRSVDAAAPRSAVPPTLDLASIPANVEQDADTLTHRRQHGISFGDFFSVGILGIATLLLALGGLPQSTDATSVQAIAWERFLLECFVILFCAVLVFLMFSLYDEITERRIPLCVGCADRTDEYGNRATARLDQATVYGVWFRAEQEDGIAARRTVGSTVALSVYAILVFLLLGKWSLLGDLAIRHLTNT